MKFECEKIDMDIDLTTMKGEKVQLIFKEALTVDLAEKINAKLGAYEKECDEKNKKEPRSITHHTILANEMSIFYPDVKPQWFKSNVDPCTLQAMINFLAQGLVGLKKREMN